MSDSQVMVRTSPDGRQVQWALTAETHAAREKALEEAALLGEIKRQEDLETVVKVQTTLKQIESLIEKARKKFTEPILKAQRELKAFADAERAELQEALYRLTTLVSDWETLQAQKRRAEEARLREEQSRLERERMQKLAQATTHEQVDRIQQEYSEKAAAQSDQGTPPPTQPRNLVVKEEWEIQSIDVWKLVKARPDLIRSIEPDKVAIKAALQEGAKIPGVTAQKKIKTHVRASAKPIIDV